MKEKKPKPKKVISDELLDELMSAGDTPAALFGRPKKVSHT